MSPSFPPLFCPFLVEGYLEPDKRGRKEAVLSQNREAGAPAAEKRTNPKKKVEGTTGGSVAIKWTKPWFY